MKILFIDDDQMSHVLVGKMIQSIGMPLVHAFNVQEGIDKLKSEDISLIITDIHMNGIDGLSFLTMLKKDKKLNTIPVVVVTSDANEEKAKFAFHQGAVGFLKKPFAEQELLHLVQTFAILDSSRFSESDPDEFLARKKHKLTTLLAKDSLALNHETAIENYMGGLNEIFDFSSIGFFMQTNQFNYVLVKEKGDIPFLNDLKLVNRENSSNLHRLVTMKSEVFSNDLLRNPNPQIKNWANEYSLVSEVLLPFFKYEKTSYFVGSGLGTRTNEMNGFFWGFRNTILSSLECETLIRLSNQANPILYGLLNLPKITRNSQV